MKAPLPPDEKQRLATLQEYAVLDTPAEEIFDDLTELAAHICEAPIALITFIDEKRQAQIKGGLGTIRNDARYRPLRPYHWSKGDVNCVRPDPRCPLRG